MRHQLTAVLASLLLATAPLGCSAGDEPGDSEGAEFPDGKGDGGIDEGSPEAIAVLALVNAPDMTAEELDGPGRLNATAANNIMAHRDGPDGVSGTSDDDLFDDLAELDDVSHVGPVALEALLAYAREKGLLVKGDMDVVFSPQAIDDAHTARIADLIDDAQDTIDIAMYSYSDARISDALERAVTRGVSVRFLFEKANKEKSLTGSDLENSRSGRLERIGVNVRFVNKIMHHKFMIVDGPRDDLARAGTAVLVTGSGNWSFTAATVFDENTLFATGQPELALRFQREFDLMWNHSRDLVVGTAKPFEISTATITDADITDHLGQDVLLTSVNFNISQGSTTFRLRDATNLTVAKVLVEAIENADESIWVASGHLRLRPVAQALIAKKLADSEHGHQGVPGPARIHQRRRRQLPGQQAGRLPAGRRRRSRHLRLRKQELSVGQARWRCRHRGPLQDLLVSVGPQLRGPDAPQVLHH